jgi:hypothetical protein
MSLPLLSVEFYADAKQMPQYTELDHRQVSTEYNVPFSLSRDWNWSHCI